MLLLQFSDLSKFTSVDPSMADKPLNWTSMMSNMFSMMDSVGSLMSGEMFVQLDVLPDLPGYTSEVTMSKWDSMMDALTNMETMDVTR